ncbi:YqhA family protein [Roseomonas gilardii subsp. gilardii]|uniref:YqhA family protein n=1 Tax=Roseomonas gilardii TaxID=257708 RepID=UPI001FF90345|nr:YqhA family protein [Roseomonas gilardii]UPG72243.1 YqhA family protein [Roseomonas gilardii subsp. gilardii]
MSGGRRHPYPARMEDKKRLAVQRIESFIALSRWLVLPLHLGLIVSLLVLIATFMRELLGLALRIGRMSEHETILGLLTLIDLALVGSLVVIVVFSSYENIISRLSPESSRGWPIWLTTVDFAGLKRKLFASMAAISAVALLKALMRLEDTVSERQLLWLVVINIVFIVGYVLMSFADRSERPTAPTSMTPD